MAGVAFMEILKKCNGKCNMYQVFGTDSSMGLYSSNILAISCTSLSDMNKPFTRRVTDGVGLLTPHFEPSMPPCGSEHCCHGNT